MTIAQLLDQLMASIGAETQEEYEAATGISQATLSSWRNGKWGVGMSGLRRLLKAHPDQRAQIIEEVCSTEEFPIGPDDSEEGAA